MSSPSFVVKKKVKKNIRKIKCTRANFTKYKKKSTWISFYKNSLKMTTHLTSWSSKMSFQRSGSKNKTAAPSGGGSRSNSPLQQNQSPSRRSPAKSTVGLRQQFSSQASPRPTSAASTRSLTDKDFADKGTT